MDNELREHVTIERVELIARLITEGICKEHDREVALSLIADITSGLTSQKCDCSVGLLTASPAKS